MAKILFLILVLLLTVSAHNQRQRFSKIKYYEYASPIETSHPHARRSAGFPETTSYTFRAFDKDFKLSLKQKTHLIDPQYFHELQRFDKNGNLIESIKNNTLPGNCFYGGVVNDNPSSIIAVSTCRGLHGFIHHPDGVKYMIEPIEGGKRVEGSHFIYRIQDVDHNMENFCGVPHIDDQRSKKSTLVDPTNKVQQQNNNNKKSLPIRSVGLVVVNDNKRFTQLSYLTEQDTFNIVNIVDSYYSNTSWGSYQYEVRLVRQMTWQWGDPITPTFDSNNEVYVVGTTGLLNLYNQWYASNPPYGLDYDDHQLYSGYKFQGSTLGLADVGTMCTGEGAGAVIQTYNQPDNSHSATISAHEMGHNFGMQHDTANPCPPGIDIMSPTICETCPAASAFSSCSINYLNSYCSGSTCSCLDNMLPPGLWGEPVCGNGIIEYPETCDCGLKVPDSSGNYPTSCSARNDNCCNGTTCQLFPGKQCDALQPCCTSSCNIINDTSLVCRQSSSVCVLTQYCNGTSAACPPNLYESPTKSCGSTNTGACYMGECVDLTAICVAQNQKQECIYSLGLNNGDPCGKVYCSGNTDLPCYDINMPVPDGAPCATARICYHGQCVNAAYAVGVGECIPATCTDYVNQCGTNIQDGCGGTINCNCQNGIICDQGSCQLPIGNLGSISSTLGCFIATAAYGSENDVNVWTLRTFRDNYMKGSVLGEYLIQTYYTYSPFIAHFIAQHELARQVTRLMLQPIVFVIQNVFL